MRLAIKTMEAINRALVADGGNAYRAALKRTLLVSEGVFRQEEEGFRTHLGASLIGKQCARFLWYSFHWAIKPSFDGRMIRLFERGHLEEPRFAALLEMTGVKTYQTDPSGKQFRMSAVGGHFGGSLDAVATGVPDIPGAPVLCEFKTHNDKSFKKLVATGVRVCKPEHFVQCQMYMGAYSLPWALYLAVNKNDDDIHAELIQFDVEVYSQHLDRAERIIRADSPPPKINESPSWFACKYCDAAHICHGKGVPERNCRTCVYCVIAGPEWRCQVNHSVASVVLDKKAQALGCSKHQRGF